MSNFLDLRQFPNSVSKPLTLLIQAKELIEKDPSSEATKGKIKEAISSLDKASQKGVLHKNNAARRKSRLLKKLSVATKK